MSTLKIGIILGSTRPGRNGEAVAQWVHGLAKKRTDAHFELVDLLVQELQGNRNLWTPSKRADQDHLNARLFEHLMRLRPPLLDADKAGVLADRLMEQARANHARLVQV